jgi:mRNA interferase MazF
VKRGEIWWAELPPPAGRRPVLLLSRDEAYSIREFVTIAPVTTKIRRIPSEVMLGPDDGLPKECVVNLDSITTIGKSRLSQRLAVLSSQNLQKVEESLHFALGLMD